MNVNIFETVINASPLGFVILENTRETQHTSSGYRFLDVNPAFEKVSGLKNECIKGKTIHEISLQEEGSVADWNSLFEKVLAENEAGGVEHYIDHLEKWVVVCGYHIDDLQSVIVISEVDSFIDNGSSRFLSLYKTMALGVVYHDSSGAITLTNSAAEEILGLTMEELQGRKSIDPRWRAIREDGSDFPGEEHPAMIALRSGLPVHDVVMGVFHPIEEEYRWILVNATPEFRKGQSKPYQVYATFADITRRKQAEDHLREKEARHTEIISNISDILWEYEVNSAGQFVRSYVSPVVDQMLGLPKGTVGNDFEKFFKFVQPEDLHITQHTLNASLFFEEGVIHRAEYRVITNDGSMKYLRSSGIVHIKPNGNRLAYGTTADITELKKKEEELVKSKAILQAIVENTLDNIWAINTNYEIIYLNENFRQAYFAAFNIVLQPGSNKLQSLPEVMRSSWKERYDKVLSGERIEFIDMVEAPGLSLYIEVAGNPIIQDGIVIGASFFGRDITGRKKMEQELSRNVELNTKLLTTIPDVVVQTDLEGIITYVNEPVLVNFPFITSDQLLGQSILSFIAPDDLSRIQENFRLMLEKPLGVQEYTLFFKNEISIRCDVNGDVIRNKHGNPTGMVFVIRDITERKRVEEALLQSEERFRSILNNVSTVAVQGYDMDGTVKYWNKASESFYGYTEKDALGQNLLNLIIPPPMRDNVRNGIDHMSQTREVIPASELGLMRSNGSIIPVFSSHVLVQVPGKELELFCIDVDLSERKQAEEELKASEKKYQELSTLLRLMADNMQDMLWAKNLKKEYIFANKAICNNLLSAIDTEEPIGKTDMFFALRQRNAQPRNPQWHTFGEICRDSDSITIEAMKPLQFDEFGNVKGKFLFLDVHKAPLFDDKGQLIGVVGSARDVTAAKEAENQLRKLSQAVEQSPASVVITDPNGTIEYVNPKFTETTGYTLEEIIGKKPNMLHAGEKSEENIAEHWKKASSGKEWKGELHYKKKNGDLYWVSVHISPIKNEKGEILHYLGVNEDITDSKMQAEKIRITRDTYESIFNSVTEAIYVLDENGYFIDVNLGAEIMYEYTRHELIGKRPADVSAPGKNDLDANQKILQEVRETGISRTFEFWGQRKCGEVFPKEVIINRGKYFGKDQIIATSRDITDQKRTETARRIQFNIARSIHTVTRTEDLLETIRQELSQLFDTANFFVAQYNPDTDTLKQLIFRDEMDSFDEWNAKQSISGYVVKSRKTIFLRGEELNTFSKQHNLEVLGTNPACWLGVPVVINNQAGGVMVIQHYSNPEAYNEADVALFEIIAHEAGIYLEKQKMIEDLIKAKDKAEESDRLKSAFLANMSHEIRTPMNGILGFADLLKELDDTGGKQQQYIEIIKKSGQRMLNIINDIIDISKIESGVIELRLSESNINEQLEYIHTFFKPEVEAKGLKLLMNDSLSLKEATIITDREKLYVIITNLVKNAIKYTERGEIEFGCVAKDDHLEFYVKDSGIGIPEDRREAIFERFIQADIEDKMARQGAGLGLSISKAYVEMLGGRIWVESTEEIGSAFYFTLPRIKGSTPNRVEDMMSPQSKAMGSSVFNILIVEDDDISELLLEIELKKIGKRILKARNGIEAIKIVRNNPDTDLILMDIRLPELDGYEATRQIRQFNKDVIIIAQTAYGLSGDRDKAIEAGCNEYISKPIKIDDLRLVLQKCFNKG